MSGFLSAARFIPDAISRIRVAGYRFDVDSRFQKPLVMVSSAVLLIAAGALGILVARYFISWSLGPEWLMSIPIFIFFWAQEVARGVFQFLGNNHIKNGQPAKAHNSSLTLAISILPALLIFSQIFGITGVPIGFLFCYTLSILATRKVWVRSA
jgi:O-antigen/teichoic acid export membrane protein